MFFDRVASPNGDLVKHGPYRWFKNPMYGVGNLQGYGSALLVGSWPGLAVAALFQASVYVFYYLFERPFVIRAYTAEPARAEQSA
jgi:protein-S-isoprenylcysteine O-methyltransferase Ste14